MGTIRELLVYIVARKKYVLFPLIFACLFLGGLFLLGANPTISPFIYALF